MDNNRALRRPITYGSTLKHKLTGAEADCASFISFFSSYSTTIVISKGLPTAALTARIINAKFSSSTGVHNCSL